MVKGDRAANVSLVARLHLLPMIALSLPHLRLALLFRRELPPCFRRSPTFNNSKFLRIQPLLSSTRSPDSNIRKCNSICKCWILAVADAGVFADATDHTADFCIADDRNRLRDRPFPKHHPCCGWCGWASCFNPTYR